MALELAWVVARLGERARPAVAAPGPLRRVVNFAKLSGTALTTLRRVLDDDPEFRQRVAVAAKEPEVDRASWLFLHRPPGWEVEITAIASDLADRTATQQAERLDRVALRRAAGLEAALRRSDEALAVARSEVRRLTGDLTIERRARKEAEEKVAGFKERLRTSADEIKLARSRAVEADERRAAILARLAATEADLAAGQAALVTARQQESEVERQRRQLEQTRQELSLSEAQFHDARDVVVSVVADAAAAADQMADALRRAVGAVIDPATNAGPPIAVASGRDPSPRGEQASADEQRPGREQRSGSEQRSGREERSRRKQASSDAQRSGREERSRREQASAEEQWSVRQQASGQQGHGRPGLGRQPSASPGSGEQGISAASSRPARSSGSPTLRPDRVLRRPIPLPPAIFDDSAEAAEHLVRRAGVLVLVDGYNATLSVWPDEPLVVQRRRLLDAAAGLTARTGAEVHVVFDGDEHPQALPPPASRRRVRFSFSAPGVEADDVLLALVERVDANRPVVVASSDRRVCDGVRARGANAISVRQLFAVLRRDGGEGKGSP